MLKITKQNNSIYVEGLDHNLYPYEGVVSMPLNSVIVGTDESDIVTFRSACNYDVLFSGRIDEITINGQGVTKENIGSVFGSAFNVAGGGGGLTPEQEEKLENAVQIADYNADKEAQATIDESQNAAIEGLSNELRDNHYTKDETDGKVNEAKASANTAISIASSAEGIATAAHSRADEALEELEKKADKSEIPSLDGYATESWVEGKGYLTEETDPTVPSHVKAITEENIAKWNEGGKTGEVVGNNEAPKDNVGIGIFNGDGGEIHDGDPLNTGDLFYMRPLNVGEIARVGKATNSIGFVYNDGDASPYYQYNHGTKDTWVVYNSNMVEVEDGKILKGEPLYVKYLGESGVLFNVHVFAKAGEDKSGVYVYDGTEEPSKVATEKTLEGFVDVETYNKHITDQTAVDEAQNSAIEGIEGDITRIDSKIDEIELFKFPNVTIIGEPTIQSGQISGFSTMSYLQFPFILDLHNQAFQIDFCFTTATNVQTQQNILDSKFGIGLAIKNGKGLMSVSSNGTSWNIGSVEGTMTIESNTTYYARLVWNGNQYMTLLSTDGVEYSMDMVITSSEAPYPTTIFIGGCDIVETGHDPHPFLGTINMNKAQLTVMGNVVWQGMDDAGLATRLATNLNNIDEVGKERIKEIVGTIPTKTSELTNDSGFLTEETDPVWNSEKDNYYTKDETFDLVDNVRSTAEGAYHAAQDASSVASTAESKADEALTTLEGKADKNEIPSLDGYATEEWVEGKGYLTEHQDISGKQDVITDLADIREGAALGKTALQSFTETDPTVPAHVKAITEEDIAKWNQGGGGEPDEYIKSAEKSTDGNTLTLTKKDGSEVVFSPSTGGGGDGKTEIVSLNNYRPVNVFDGGFIQIENGTVLQNCFGIGSVTSRTNPTIQIDEDTLWSINVAFRTPSELGVSEQVLVDIISTDTTTHKWRLHIGIQNEGRLRFLIVKNDGDTLMDFEGMMPDIEPDTNYILTMYTNYYFTDTYVTFYAKLYNQKTGHNSEVLNTSYGYNIIIPPNKAKIQFGQNASGRGDTFQGLLDASQCSMYVGNKPLFRTVDKFVGQIDWNDTITLEGTLEDGSTKKFILIGIEG